MANDMTANRPEVLHSWTPWKVLFRRDGGFSVYRDNFATRKSEHAMSPNGHPSIYNTEDDAQSRANHLNGQTS